MKAGWAGSARTAQIDDAVARAQPSGKFLPIAPAEKRASGAQEHGLSLRHRIMLMFLLAILPLIGTQIWNAVEGYRAREREAFAEVSRLAIFASHELDQIIGTGHALLASLVVLPATRAHDAAACSAIAAEI